MTLTRPLLFNLSVGELSRGDCSKSNSMSCGWMPRAMCMNQSAGSLSTMVIGCFEPLQVPRHEICTVTIEDRRNQFGIDNCQHFGYGT